jgi:nucleotide-binding universal stress UspA family protein
MLLIAYDGSTDAKAAIDYAGEFLSGEAATVLSVWEPFLERMARTPTGLEPLAGIVDFDELDQAYERGARDRAAEGVERAKAAGLDPQPRTRAVCPTVAEAILSEAADVDARAIVLGTRGLTGLKSLLMGSVSHAVLQDADRPVIVVPSPDVASERAARRI